MSCFSDIQYFDLITNVRRTVAANLRPTPKSINVTPLMSFLQNHMQAGREEKMKIPMGYSEDSGPKKLLWRLFLKRK
jgi:hypothetical protein